MDIIVTKEELIDKLQWIASGDRLIINERRKLWLDIKKELTEDMQNKLQLERKTENLLRKPFMEIQLRN